MKPLAVFDVRPEPRKRRYFRVLVWGTLKELRAYTGVKAYAVTTYYTLTPPGADKYRSAEISFAQRYLTHGLLTHEGLHAILAWAHAVGIDLTKSFLEGIEAHEERVCDAIGRTLGEIIERLTKEGFTIK